MKSSKLDKRVTIQERVESRGSMGSQKWEWRDWKTVWAGIETLRGQEYFAAVQLQNKNFTRIRIRWRAGVREKMRVRYQVEPGSPGVFKYYDIEQIIEIGRRDELQLMCVERTADGFQD